MKEISRTKIDDLKVNITLKEKKDNKEYELVEIDIELVDKINFKVIVDDGSSIDIMLESTINKLDLKITHKALIKVKHILLKKDKILLNI